ncbi:transmembrane and TPR repeat-containing protein 4-like isoform X2 [Pomacea canaliculata]|uniref:transmembrane and TPR repeat-containing protein 4-like isoform X2 n=1 Tax=Pomacea canaliculata TaxID=400727 RepID=UPI000D73FD13|nr:transmembrane and TPR repeat-containing protein 4-like isoform X2 [Pomacea canaliculata]
MSLENCQKENGKIKTTFQDNGCQHVHPNTPRHWDGGLPLPALSPTFARVVIFAIAVVCYGNSYDGNFVFDDSEAIVNNKDVLPERPVTDLLLHDFWGNQLVSKQSHKSYRPITVLTYRWNVQLAGGVFPKGFHIVNIILHGLVSVLLFSAFISIVSTHSSNHTSKAAFLSSLLFAVHPIHTESVAGLVGRADLLCALFFLLSFMAYVKTCTNDNTGRLCFPEKVDWLWMILSVVFCFLATFSKEQGITVLGVSCAYDIIFVCQIHPLKLLSPQSACKLSRKEQQNGHSRNQRGSSPWLQSLIQRQFVLIFSAVAFLLLRLKVMGLSPPTFQVHDNPHSFANGSLYRALNYNYLYAINSWLLLNPWWLCFDWSMGCVPVITSLTDPRLLPLAAFLFVMGCLFICCFKTEMDHEDRCLVLGLTLLVLPFLPASNIFFRVGFVIAERNLYLPSAGFCLLVSLGAVRLSQFRSLKLILAAALCALLLTFVCRSVQRSYQWREELSLFKDGEKVCPLNGKVHYNIAKLVGDMGETELAIEKYQLAIKLNPQYDQAMNNLANILKDQGDTLEAEELLTKAVSINHEFAAAWMNLGIVQAQLRKFDLAETSYQTALQHRRKYPDCYYNLGNLFLEQERHQEALDAWHMATRLKPQHVNAWSNAMILLDNLGHYEKTIKMGEMAREHLPNSAVLWFHMANAYGKMERWQDSERCFLAAIQLEPAEEKYYLNLGNILLLD